MSFFIHQGNVLAVLGTLPDDSFDACLTDPPYGLSEKRNLRSASPRKSSREARRSGGFMGMLWDSDVPETNVWEEVYRVLKPGGFLLAFGGTRTYHKLACNIEDAGFYLSDTICWLFSQGFPKGNLGDGRGSKLKPAWEPITVALKPIEGNFLENAAKWGVLGLSIDECRIPTSDVMSGWNGNPPYPHENNQRPSRDRFRAGEASAERVYADRGGVNFQAKPGVRGGDPAGRWPANVLLDEGAAVALDEQTGIRTSGANPTRRHSDKFRNSYQPFEGQRECEPIRGADSGGTSRFFYCAKSSASDRGEGNTHPTVKPSKLTEYLAKLILPPTRDTLRRLLVPYSGSGSEMLGALRGGWDHVEGIEGNESYIAIAQQRLAGL